MNNQSDTSALAPPAGDIPSLSGHVDSVAIEQLIAPLPLWKQKQPTMFEEFEPTGEFEITASGDFLLPRVGDWVLVCYQETWCACLVIGTHEVRHTHGEHRTTVRLRTRRDWMRWVSPKLGA